jgi:LysM repeat protein
MPVRIGNVNLGGTQLPQAAGGGRYKVGSGDSLGKIAGAFGVSVSALRQANSAAHPALGNPAMDATSLKVGMVLTIPGAADPGGATPTDPTPAPTTGGTRDNDVMALGFNPTFGAEVAGRHVPDAWKQQSLLQRASRHGYETEVIYGAKYSQVTLANGSRLDLAPLKAGASRGDHGSVDTAQADTNLKTAVDSLQLPGAIGDAVFAAIKDNAKAEGYGRDELFKLAALFADAEKGGDIPDRLMLSSHHTSHWYGDDDYGDVKEGAFNALLKAMPKAADQLRHVGFFGCFTAGMNRVTEFKELLPNVESMWFYEGISAGAGNGSVFHMKEWDLASMGNKSFEQALNTVATRYRGFRGEAAAAWSKSEGYLGDQFNRTVTQLRDRVTSSGQNYDSYLDGSMDLPYETSTGPVREYYSALQHLSMHPDLTDTERSDLQGKIAQSIRLVFYRKMIRPKLHEHHGTMINQALASVGSSPIDLSTPGGDDVRKKDLDLIAEFEQKAAGSTDPNVRVALRLLGGLRSLHENVIPNTWV